MRIIAAIFKKQEYKIVFLLALFVVITYQSIIVPLGLFDKMRLKSSDILFGIRNAIMQPSRMYSDIVIIAIDDKTLKYVDERWPWRRAFYAQIINALGQAHPRFIAIDLTFLGSQKDDAQDDVLLRDAIAAQNNVILASYFSSEAAYIAPKTLFAEAAYAVGFVNKVQDSDLRIRNARLVVFKDLRQKVPLAYSFEIQCLLKLLGAREVSYRNGHIVIACATQPLYIPVGLYGITPVNYMVSPRKIRVISLVDFLDNKDAIIPQLKDAMLFLGQTSKISHEVFPTPVGFVPGVMINAYTFLTLAEHRFIAAFPAMLMAVFLFIVCVAAGFGGMNGTPLRGISVFLGVMLGASACAVYSFTRGFFVDIVSVWSLGFVLYISGISYRYGQILKLKNNLRRLLTIEVATGFFNRRYFLCRLDFELKRAKVMHGKLHAFIFLFAPQPRGAHNGTAGAHLVYEQQIDFLKDAGRAIDGFFTPFSPVIGTYADNMIGVFVRNVARENAMATARRACERLSQNLRGDDYGFVRCAMASYPEANFSSGFVMARSAELALARGTRLGSNFIEYDPREDTQATDMRDTKEYENKEEISEIEEDMQRRNEELRRVIAQMKAREEELHNAYFNTIVSLINALEEKDQYTAGHSQRVSAYAVKLGKQMGLPEEEIELVREAALLHDIGKIGLPDALLHKKQSLTSDDVALLHKHQSLGSHILEPIAHFKDHLPLIISHHEWYNGKGYPHGLSGAMIPRGAQIIAIADTFDAMTTGRGYNKVLSPREAAAELQKCRGTQFNPAYVDSFLETLKKDAAL